MSEIASMIKIKKGMGRVFYAVRSLELLFVVAYHVDESTTANRVLA